MSTDVSYDLGRMLPGVLDNALNGGRCRSCGRETNDQVVGHDGFCPVPALAVMTQELDYIQKSLLAEKKRAEGLASHVAGLRAQVVALNTEVSRLKMLLTPDPQE